MKRSYAESRSQLYMRADSRMEGWTGRVHYHIIVSINLKNDRMIIRMDTWMDGWREGVIHFWMDGLLDE